MKERNEPTAPKEGQERESIQQQPASKSVKGVKTPEPPQVKDPSSLPTSDQQLAHKQNKSKGKE